jgi:ribosomal protein L11 methyltransferase
MMSRVFTPFDMGEKFTVVPKGHSVLEDGRFQITLGYGRAFGSGQHETTANCIKKMEKMGPLAGLRVLDFGTGTGILSLAAASLGSDMIVAFDIEQDAALAAANNAELNGVSEEVLIFCGNLDCILPDSAFDLILANIYGDIILGNSGSLFSLLSQGGTMVLSGIDYADSTHIKDRLNGHGLNCEEIEFLEDYVTQVWFKPAG